MSHRLARFFTALLTLVLLAGPGATIATAQVTVGQLAQNSQRAEPRVSAAEAAAIVQKAYGGKVMNVSTRHRDGRIIHRVKLLQNDGRMRTVSVDGNNGKILN